MIASRGLGGWPSAYGFGYFDYPDEPMYSPPSVVIFSKPTGIISATVSEPNVKQGKVIHVTRVR